MTKKIFYATLLLLASCASKDYQRPDTAIDTGRDFIRASLDGDFKKAEILILNDTPNHQLFDSYKILYNRMPAEQKQGYKKASYEINKLTDVNDSTTLINYSNSFMHQPMEIKVIKRENTWYIDFEHSYSDNTAK